MTGPACDWRHVADNLAAIRARLAAAAARAARPPDSVRLVAVSKKQPPEALLAAWEAGHRTFGENYVQEGVAKVRWLTERGVDAAAGLEMRLIGPLQRNKARDAAQHFAAVETLDSAELAARLQGQCERFGRAALPVLIEVNLAGEASKSGLDAAGAAALLARAAEFPALQFAGLMSVPPVRDSAEASRGDFLALRRLRDALRSGPRPPNAVLDDLSMGMSHDFELAVECGATEVRVGTALFGPRT